MPRPRNTPGRLASKNGIRSRKFSIVIHDVEPSAKQILQDKVNDLEPDWSLIALEPYNHQEGHHLHLFIKYHKPKAKSKVLQYLQRLELGGRVQVDVGRGDFEQCRKYLVDPDKEKKLDNDITENVRLLSLVERHPEHARTCPGCNKKYYDPPYMFQGKLIIDGQCNICWTKKFLAVQASLKK